METSGWNSDGLRKSDETLDEILEGSFTFLQKKRGYRFSLDSLLLAHFVRLRKKDRVIDLGTGSGVIAIITARRKECAKVVGLEIQEELADMARRNVVLNGLEGKVEILQGDVKNIKSLFDVGTFDVVVLNPPYSKVRSGRVNPDVQKSIARHEIKGTLNDFLNASAHVLTHGGRTFIIYPASRLVGLLTAMRKVSIEPKKVRMVHSYRDSRGDFILVEGRKNGREEAYVLTPLVVYEKGGEYTEAMKRLFKELSALRHDVSV